MEIESIIRAIIDKLQDNLAIQTQAAKDAHLAATHSESVAESKYDTFGLESSYLAQGQQKRVQEITIALSYFKSCFENCISTDHKNRQFIEPLCFITLLDESEQLHYFFLADQAGGLKLSVADKTISVITPGSPIGGALSDKMVSDCIDLNFKGQNQSLEIVEIG